MRIIGYYQYTVQFIRYSPLTLTFLRIFSISLVIDKNQTPRVGVPFLKLFNAWNALYFISTV
jgi:hypothetical protein